MAQHCPDCSETLTWATDKETGERIALNDKATALTGDGRYIFTSHDPPTVQRVATNYRGYAYPDHRTVCARVQREARL